MGENLPVASSQLQFLMIGLSAILLLAVLMIIRMLWNVRSPAFALMASWAQSEQGRLVLAGILRDYLSLPEGKTFMEGVINGKVRMELTQHNTALDAHHRLQQEFARVDDLNAAMTTVRAEHTAMAKAMQDGICAVVSGTLEKKFDELRRDLRKQ